MLVCLLPVSSLRSSMDEPLKKTSTPDLKGIIEKVIQVLANFFSDLPATGSIFKALTFKETDLAETKIAKTFLVLGFISSFMTTTLLFDLGCKLASVFVISRERSYTHSSHHVYDDFENETAAPYSSYRTQLERTHLLFEACVFTSFLCIAGLIVNDLFNGCCCI